VGLKLHCVVVQEPRKTLTVLLPLFATAMPYVVVVVGLNTTTPRGAVPTVNFVVGAAGKLTAKAAI
jgi:hypothetical protein